MSFQVNDNKAGTASKPQIQQGKNQIYPACLPRVDDEYNSGRLWVAGWGLTKQRKLKDVSFQIEFQLFIQVWLTSDNFLSQIWSVWSRLV